MAFIDDLKGLVSTGVDAFKATNAPTAEDIIKAQTKASAAAAAQQDSRNKNLLVWGIVGAAVLLVSVGALVFFFRRDS